MLVENHRGAPAAPAAGQVVASHGAGRKDRAMLAICSDLDDTPDAATYFELMRFLNTREDTSMGPGVGLEIGNTIYFDMAPGKFSYWNASEADRERIRRLIRSGHVDCLHSFGDLATTRRHAARALEELQKHGCRIRVWVDHARAPTNFGADPMQGHGDEPGHPAYHADLTLSYGISHIWRGRVTSVIGQNRPTSFKGIASVRHPLVSARTLLKEAAKHLHARRKNSRYAVHAGNRLLKPGTLRDGREFVEFIRCNPHWSGVSGTDHADGFAGVLTPEFLERLERRGGACVLYTHLGRRRTKGASTPLPETSIAAFRRLAQYHQEGRICVTTTSRLLEHLSTEGSRPASARLSFPPLD